MSDEHDHEGIEYFQSQLQNIAGERIPGLKIQRKYYRQFSDGVLLARLIHYERNELVEPHNYTPTLSTGLKKSNWETLGRKVLSKIGIVMQKSEIEDVCMGKVAAIDKILIQVGSKFGWGIHILDSGFIRLQLQLISGKSKNAQMSKTTRKRIGYPTAKPKLTDTKLRCDSSHTMSVPTVLAKNSSHALKSKNALASKNKNLPSWRSIRSKKIESLSNKLVEIDPKRNPSHVPAAVQHLQSGKPITASVPHLSPSIETETSALTANAARQIEVEDEPTIAPIPKVRFRDLDKRLHNMMTELETNYVKTNTRRC